MHDKKSCSQVAAGDDGTVICRLKNKLWILKDDNLHIDGTAWEEFGVSEDISISKVVVGNKDNIWGIGNDNKVYKFDNTKKKARWEHVEGQMMDISVNSKGDVWATNKLSQVFKYVGNDEWQRVQGNLKAVTVV